MLGSFCVSDPETWSPVDAGCAIPVWKFKALLGQYLEQKVEAQMLKQMQPWQALAQVGQLEEASPCRDS